MLGEAPQGVGIGGWAEPETEEPGREKHGARPTLSTLGACFPSLSVQDWKPKRLLTLHSRSA